MLQITLMQEEPEEPNRNQVLFGQEASAWKLQTPFFSLNHFSWSSFTKKN